MKLFKLYRAIFNFGIFTILSRILGYIRDVLILRTFGANILADAFLIAFKIPNISRKLIADGALSIALTPTLANDRLTQNSTQEKIFIRTLLNWIYIILGGVCALLIYNPMLAINTIAPGLQSPHLAFDLVRIMASNILIFSLLSIISCILQVRKIYNPTAILPIILNFSMIFSIFITKDILYVSYSVLISGFAQIIFLFYVCYYNNISLNILPIKKIFHPEILTFIKKFIPAISTAGILQMNLYVDAIFASYLNPGSISTIYAAERLLELPLALIGVSLSYVLLTDIAILKDSEKSRISAIINFGLYSTLVLGIPAAFGLYIFADIIIDALFGYGEFGYADIVNTANILQAFSPAALSILISKWLNSCFIGRNHPYIPLYSSILCVIINILGNYILCPLYGASGLALSTSIATSSQAFLLWVLASKYFTFDIFNLNILLKIIISTTIMLSIYYLKPLYTIIALPKIITTLLLIITAIISYFFCLYCLNFYRYLNTYQRSIQN